jgi:uroporphyrinogen decarboxylase
VDWQTPIEKARKLVDPKVGLQGNLDPRIVFADKATIEEELKKYLNFGRENQNWIFNFGHGFLPGSPYENAKFICDWVKDQNWR